MWSCTSAQSEGQRQDYKAVRAAPGPAAGDARAEVEHADQDPVGVSGSGEAAGLPAAALVRAVKSYLVSARVKSDLASACMCSVVTS